jgi:dihydrofolate reductase
MSTQGPKVQVEMSMSLDGFVARTDHSTEEVPEEWRGRDAPFTFVTDGVESAIRQAKAVAGDKPVGVAGGNIAMQCLQLGLPDELQIHLVPVLLGDGIRMFEAIEEAPVQLEQTRVVEGRSVVHLFYDVVRPHRTAA